MLPNIAMPYMGGQEFVGPCNFVLSWVTFVNVKIKIGRPEVHAGLVDSDFGETEMATSWCIMTEVASATTRLKSLLDC